MSPFEKHGILHLSPSSINLFCDEPAFWAFKYVHKFKDRAGAPAWRGSAVEAGLDQWFDKQDHDAAYEAALARFEADAMGEIEAKIDKERAALTSMVDQAIEVCRENKLGTPTGRQIKVEHWFDGIEIPVIGYADYEWEPEGVDLKTKSRMPREIPAGHARQVALYEAARRKPYSLLYVTERKGDLRRLSREESALHLRRLEWTAHSIRRVLSMFSCKFDLARAFSPDFSSFYWNNRQARLLATEIWDGSAKN